ncbi:MAG: cysteine desulfurase [Gammaproteobacteria bacterium]|nr:cysteine desulfurase [Gammaproteobacteria bacterium]
MTIDFDKLRGEFPLLKETTRGKPLIYLDNSATNQKPQVVIDALNHYYCHDNANIHRGVYELSERATREFEKARVEIQTFINAAHSHEIIFVRGATEGINLVAQSYGRSQLKADDEIIISTMEHHSNIVPWQMLTEQVGAKLRVIPISDSGEIDIDDYKKLFNARTKMVAIAHASNALGTINPIKEMAAIAHEHGVPILVDGAQAFPHMPVDVQDLDCDFYVFSSHKAYGPTGIGVLYGKEKLLEKMPPYQGGGDMIESVSFTKTTYNKLPFKFEAGTPDIAGVIGFGVAVKYLKAIGMQNIAAHEQDLLVYGTQKLSAIPGLKIIGTAKQKVGVISFVLEGVHPHDIGTILDDEGVAIRAGHHCAMPVMERYHIPATVRASFGLYNTNADIDALVKGIMAVKKVFA